MSKVYSIDFNVNQEDEMMQIEDKCIKLGYNYSWLVSECPQTVWTIIIELDAIQVKFENAINLIREFLDDVYAKKEYSIAPKTTNSFKKFKDETLKNGYITISLEGCEDSIYSTLSSSGVKHNILARLWHDNHHLINDLNFSYDDECKTCEYQNEEFYIWAMDNKKDFNTLKNAIKIISIDIKDQAKYFKDNNDFVENQISFVYDKFKEVHYL